LWFYVIACTTTAAEALLAFVLPPYLQELGYPVGPIGLLVGLAAGAALVSRLPVGLLYQRGSVGLLLGGSLLAAAATTLLYPLATDALPFAGIRVVSGLAYGAATTVNLARFVDTRPAGASRSQAMAFYAGSMAAGFAVGNGPGGLVAEWRGYTTSFVFAAALYAAALAAALPAQRQPVPAASAPRPAGPTPDVLHQLQLAALDPGTRSVTLAAFLLAFLTQTLSVYVTLFGLLRGVTLAEMGFIRAAFSVLQAVTRSLAGPVARRFGRQRALDGALLGQVVGMVLLASAYGFWPILLVVLAVGLCRAVTFVANSIALTEDVDESRVGRGVASGLFNAATDLGQIVGPTVGGFVAQAIGLDWMFRVLPPLLFVGYLVAMRTSRRPRAQPVPATDAAAPER
jgi:DHA1 family multidrug resistance protein-like MFS transporter